MAYPYDLYQPVPDDLMQYFLGSGSGAVRFNRNYQPTVQQYMAGRNRPGAESLYRRQASPLAANLYPDAGGMGDFTPSAGMMGGEIQPAPQQPQVQVEPQSEQDMGMQQQAAPQRTLGLLGDIFGGASALDEYMTPEQRAQLQNQGVMAAAMQLLAASGPSRVPVGLGQALGEAYGAGQKGYTAAQQNLLQSMAAKQKMDEYKRQVAEQATYQRDMMGGGQVGAQPAGVVTAPAGQVAAVDLGIAPTGTPSAAMPTGFASLTQEQRMILSRLPAKEGYKEALRLMEPKPDTSPDDIKKLRALNLPVTLENLQSLKQEASPVEIRLLKELNLPLTFDNVIKLRQSTAAQQNVRVDTGDKTRAVEINKDIVAQMGTMTEQARSANETLMNVDRILPALSGAITGPLADYRTTLTRIGQQFGIVGKDASEVLAKTQTLVQGLAQQELTAAGQMKGQGAITAPERELLRRAAVGDQNLTAAELQTALQTAQKVARYRIGQHQEYLNKFSALPGAEQYVPFYSVTPYQSTGGGNPMQSAIDAEIAKRAQTQRGGGMR